MDINAANLQTLDTAIRTNFNTSLLSAVTTYGRIAMTVPSTTRGNTYPKLDDIPGMREWIGERVVNRLGIDSFAITNRKFENTISVKRDDVEDDQYGIYAPLAQEFGRTAGELPDDLVWDQVKKGFAEQHYDGQFFFDTDHPVENAGGVEQSVSNLTAGTDDGWYLIDTSRSIKSFIFQDRTSAEITPKMALTDDNVFHADEYLWGARRRCASGFGAWQLIHASKAALDADSYEAARVAMMSMKGHRGRELNIRPNLLVVPPSLDGAAREILLNERNAAGATNKWRNTAELHVEPRLAAA